jgi:hypothetical protein
VGSSHILFAKYENDEIKVDEMGRAHSTNEGENRNAHRILVQKPEVKRPLGRPRRWLIDNIKKNLREIRWRGIIWTDLIEDRDQ